MRGPWLLFVLNAWQNSGVCHLGEVQVVHVDGRESRKTDSGRIVTDYPLTPLHGEEPWMLTLEGGQVGDVGLMVGHIAALHPRPNARALIWHHPIHGWVQRVHTLRWWQRTPSPKRLEHRFRQACLDEPEQLSPQPIPRARWGRGESTTEPAE